MSRKASLIVKEKAEHDKLKTNVDRNRKELKKLMELKEKLQSSATANENLV